MPTSIYEIKDPRKDGLIVIEANRERYPHQIELILNQPPWVGVVPYGPRAGQHCTFIQLSYSPLKKFPYESERSRSDWPDNPVMTIDNIVKFCKRRAPGLVYIVGGEPMFKWDDEVKHLCSLLQDADKEVFVETSGVIFPNVMEKIYTDKSVRDGSENFFEMPIHVTIKPQIFEPVPDNESGGYFQHIYPTLRMWDWLPIGMHYHFDVDMAQEEDITTLELARIVTFMREVYEIPDKAANFRGATIVFVPKLVVELGAQSAHHKERHLEHYHDLVHLVGTLLLNFPKANVLVHPHYSLL